MTRLLLFFLGLFLTCAAGAQNFTIENVTLFDGDKIQKNASVSVENGIIQAVGDQINRADGSQVIDGRGKFLMPAMTNSHVHAWASASLTEAVKAGVVNLLDMHGMEQFQGMMRNLQDSTQFARYYYAGSAATAPDGHGTQYGFPVPTLTDASQADGFVNDRLKAGAHYIKIIVEPWKPTLSKEIVKALIESAHAKETLAVVHVSNIADAEQVLKDGADGLVHIWHDAPMSEEVLEQLAAARKQFIVPTLLTTTRALETMRTRNPDKEYLTNQALLQEAKKAYDAGFTLLAGTDPPNLDINYGSDLWKELQLLTDAGIPSLDVLRSATSLPAQRFRLGKTGSIQPGYSADMILLSESPMEDMAHLESVEKIWKAGKEVQR